MFKKKTNSIGVADKITPDYVLKLKEPTSKFLCPLNLNSRVQFTQFKIRDIHTNTVLFDIQRPLEGFDPTEGDIADEASRSVSYAFDKAFFQLKQIGTTLTFAVGPEPLENFRMIERHYFKDKLLKSFDFNFGFCMPNSVNTMENVYELPNLDKKTSKLHVN